MLFNADVLPTLLVLLRGFFLVVVIVGLVWYQRLHPTHLQTTLHTVRMLEGNRLQRELTRGPVKRILAARSEVDLLAVARALTAGERVLVAWWLQDQPPRKLRLERRDRIMAVLHEAAQGGGEETVGVSAATVPHIP